MHGCDIIIGRCDTLRIPWCFLKQCGSELASSLEIRKAILIWSETSVWFCVYIHTSCNESETRWDRRTLRLRNNIFMFGICLCWTLATRLLCQKKLLQRLKISNLFWHFGFFNYIFRRLVIVATWARVNVLSHLIGYWSF